MPKVKVNDINLYYEIHSDGFPLLLIRGLGSNIDWWDPDFLDAMSKSFKIIIFDNRGAGRTDKPDIEYSIEMFADDTVGLMDALNIKRSHVLGYSMGGAIAQEISLKYPERVEKLVLCATTCGGTEAVAISPELMEILMKGAKGKSLEERAEQMIQLTFTEEFIKIHPDIIERERQSILKNPTPDFSFQRQLGAVMKFSTGGRLKMVKTPTLIVHGRKDILVPPENAQVLAKLIHDSKVAYFDNSGHAFFSQETVFVAKTILEFLK
jgi:pimeloyl-ACP methyl ester carboxylesterase